MRRLTTATGRPGRGGAACPRRGFTLVELLVVIGIITILMAIMVPTVSSVLRQGDAAKTAAILVELTGGIQQYYNDHQVYPGQKHPAELVGGGGNYTGSQVLAASMYGYTYADVNDPTPTPDAKEHYAPYESERLFNPNELDPAEPNRPNSLSDGFATPMAILYYPARIGASGTGQFFWADNEAYGHFAGKVDTAAEFQGEIADDRFGQSGVPYNPGKFLLVGASTNRTYFDGDDTRNW